MGDTAKPVLRLPPDDNSALDAASRLIERHGIETKDWIQLREAVMEELLRRRTVYERAQADCCVLCGRKLDWKAGLRACGQGHACVKCPEPGEVIPIP